MNFKITSVRIIDCGPLEDTFIDFLDSNGEPLSGCLLSGPNGCGKTTVLMVIAELISLLTKCPNHQPNIKKKIGYAQLNMLINNQHFTIYYGTKPNDVTITTDEYLGYEKSNRSDRYKRKTDGKLVSLLHALTHIEEGNEIICPDLDDVKIDGKHLPTVLFFPHNREIEPLKGRSQIFKEETHFSLVHHYKNIRQFEGSFESYLIWLDYSEPKTFNKIIKFLNEIDMDGKTFHIDRKNLQVNVKTINGSIHPLNELSSGEQNLLIILTELRRRLDRSGIVLIDELENSLHPEYQFKLLERLKVFERKMDVQFIMTSHSLEVFEHLPTNAVRLLNPLIAV